jgi:hypothetical protein
MMADASIKIPATTTEPQTPLSQAEIGLRAKRFIRRIEAGD